MEDRWLTVQSGGKPSAPENFLPELAHYESIAELEAQAGIQPGTPVIIDLNELHQNPEDYRTEYVFREFLTKSRWARLKAGTRATYATIYPPIIRWLASRPIPKALHEMDANDLAEWKQWRTDPIRNPRPVSGATWNKEVAALSLFFEWATRKGYTTENPIQDYGPELKAKTHGTERAKAGGWTSKNARIRRIDWMEPETFRLWSNVAFRGYALTMNPNGQLTGAGEDTGFRGRNNQRNAAFVEAIYFTGMREGETSLLLAAELPQRDNEAFAELRIPMSITKNGRPRVIVMPWATEGVLRRYINQERQVAIERGRKQGRYLGSEWHRITDHRYRRRELQVKINNGAWVSHDKIAPAYRPLLLIERNGQWEPAMLWLTESGTPAEPRNMIKVIQRATDGWANACTSAGYTGHIPYPTAKSLRYSFALNWLIAHHKVIDEEFGESPRDYSPSRYEDAYRAVQRQLGHQDLQTTMDAYLLAVKDLRGINIFKDATFKSVYSALHTGHGSTVAASLPFDTDEDDDA